MVILNSFDYFVWAFWKLFVWLSFYWTWSSSLLRINLFKSATFILTFIKELVWMMLWFYEKQDLQLFIINLPWSPIYMIIYRREYQIHDIAILKKITTNINGTVLGTRFLLLSFNGNSFYTSDELPSLCPALAIPGAALNMF